MNRNSSASTRPLTAQPWSALLWSTLLGSALLWPALLWPVPGRADPIRSAYSTSNGQANAVVITCPSQDGTFSAIACQLGRPATVSYAAPANASIVTANTAVTVFTAGSVATGCDVINTGSAVLYLDFTTTASAGSATAVPLQPGQSFHCAYPPAGAVSAVAGQPQAFVAVRY